jgi:hypothetical protein
MARRDTRTARTVALVGGGALLAWLLLRGGKGWRVAHGGADSQIAGTADASPCQVHVGEDHIRVDGQPAALAAAIVACQARGRAEVTASGAAIIGAINEVVVRLKEAGVRVYAEPNLWDLVTRTV